MLTADQTLQIFKECGALLEGHFLLTSGRHSGKYLEKFRVLQFPHLTSQLCAEIARRYQKDGIQTVIGPAMGGIILAFEVARQLGVRSIFTERENDKMALRRGFTVEPGERVLVVEDIVTTGGSVMELLEALKPEQPDIVGVAILADRSGGKVDFGVRTEALMTLEIETFSPEDCPLCQQGLPLVKPGSRRK